MTTSPAATTTDPTTDLPPSWSAVLLPLDVPSADGRVAVCPPADESGTIPVPARPAPPLLYLDHFDEGARGGYRVDETGRVDELMAARLNQTVAGRVDELVVRTDRDGGRAVRARGTFAPDPSADFASLLAAAYRMRAYGGLPLGIELDNIEVEEGGTEDAPTLVFTSWRVLAVAIVTDSAHPAARLVLDRPLTIAGTRFWCRPLEPLERAELHTALITDPPEDPAEAFAVASAALWTALAPGPGPGTRSDLAARMADPADPLDLSAAVEAARALAQL